MIDDVIISLYLSELHLKDTERTMNGHSDSSEWPFEFYAKIMAVADEHDDLFRAAIAKLGLDETARQLNHLKSLGMYD